MSDDQTIEVIQPLLGIDPFVLIELRAGDDGPDNIRVGLQYGGGIDVGDLADVLLMVLADLPDGTGRLGKVLASLEAEAQPGPRASTGEFGHGEGVLHAVARIREELGLDEGRKP